MTEYVLDTHALLWHLASHRFSAIPDIFDRLIVAEAVQRRLPLLTRDPAIRESQLVTTVWD